MKPSAPPGARLITLLFIPLILQAFTPSESWHLHRAQSAAEAGEWNVSLRHYRLIDAVDDRIRYNEAAQLYRLGRYREATALYREIETPELQHARYHNLGNCMMRLGDPAAARRYYRAALKFTDDPETRTNLALAEKQMKQMRKRRSRQVENSNDLRPGSIEGHSDWDREGFPAHTRLRQARVKDRTRRTNLASGGDTARSTIEGSATDYEKNGTSEGSGERSAITLRYWQIRMERQGLRTLLLPIETEGESDVPKPW